MKVRITIEYPQVMKMFLTNCVDVEDSIQLQTFKQTALDRFWINLMKHIYMPPNGRHGTIQDVFLFVENIEIVSDELLKEHLKTDAIFRVKFRDHPQ